MTGTAIMVVDNELHVDVMREDGSVVESYRGPSAEQIKYAHNTGTCGSFCGYCAHEYGQVQIAAVLK